MRQPPADTDLDKQVRLEALHDTYSRRQDGPGTKTEKLRDAFIETIELGIWRPSDPVPTEKELLSVLPISQGTVQAAMRRLAEDGIVVRKRGAGSRISSAGSRANIPWYMRFRPSDGADFASVGIVSATISEIHELGPWSEALGTKRSSVKLERTLRIADTFDVFAVAYLDAGRFRPLLDFSKEIMGYTHLRHLLHDRFNMPTLRAHETASMRVASPHVAEVVGVAPETPVLTLRTVNLSLHEEPIVYQEFHIPPNDYLLDLSRRRGRG